MLFSIPHPVLLEGEKVRLEPLRKDHFHELIQIASESGIWQHMVVNGTDGQEMRCVLQSALLKRGYGEEYPFTVFDREKNSIIGSTRLLGLNRQHKKLEIGWTWFAGAYQGTGHNTESKKLLIAFCFETLQVNRIQFLTRSANLRSRAAILKTGAWQEGILRKDRILPDGTAVDIVVYSILREDWVTTAGSGKGR